MGHSRSVSIVLAYLIRYHDLSLTAALNLVREKRPFVRPNRSFYAQLQFWEAAKSALTFNASPEYRHMRMAKDAKAFSRISPSSLSNIRKSERIRRPFALYGRGASAPNNERIHGDIPHLPRSFPSEVCRESIPKAKR